MQQCIQPTGTNRPRAWRPTRSCSLWNAQGLRKRSLRRGPARKHGWSGQAECKVSGGHGGGETPVPIPNTAVKPARADGTWGEAPWESRSPPGFLNEIPSELRLEGISSFHEVAFPRRRRCRLCFVMAGARQEELNRALVVGHFHNRLVGDLMVFFVVRWAGSTSSGRPHP